MTATDQEPTLIIHGASSYTAKELLKYLESHPDGRSFEFLLAGRTKAKLDKVNEGLKKAREVVVVDLEDEGSVKRLIAKGNVVINLAGPFRWYNAEALIKECAATGKHYVDLTGEQAWLAKDIIPKYNYLASKTGACIVPSCGFDSVPSDLSLYSALSTLQDSRPELTITKSTAMFKANGTVSGGTIASLFAEVELPQEYLTGKFRGEWCLTPAYQPSPNPKPIITLSHRLLPFSTQVGAFFVMFPFNSTIVRRSWYLSRLPDNLKNPFSDPSPTKGQGEEPKHGDKLIYEEGMDVGGSKIVAGLLSFGLFGFFALFNYSGIFRKIVKYIAPQQGTGASEETLKKGKAKVTSLSLTTDPNVAVLTTYVGLGDPGYVHTCHLLVESALSLVLPPPAGTSLPPLSARGGCLTPSTAMGQVLIERMKNMGGSVKSELLIGGKESRKGR